MRPSTKIVVALVPVALLVGCSSGGDAPSVGRSSTATSSASSSAPASSTASSSPQSSPAAPAVAFSKGQTVAADTLFKAIRVAVIKVGGTYKTTVTSATISAEGYSKVTEKQTDTVLDQNVGGQKSKIIVIDGVGYISGTGMGPTPYLKITKDSTGPLAQGLKPALSVATGGGLPDAAQWTVTSAEPDRTVLTQKESGVTVTQTMDGRNLPVSTVSKSGPQTLTYKYSDYGKPVTIAAPPASQVTDISDVKMPST